MLMRVGAAWMMMGAGIPTRNSIALLRVLHSPPTARTRLSGQRAELTRTRNSIALLRVLHSPATARTRLSGQRAELTRTRGCSS